MANWYAVQLAAGMQTMDRHQNRPRIECELDRTGIQHFNPTELRRHIHHRTKKPIHKRWPLLPGYAFVTGDFDWPSLKAVKGVVEVLGDRDAPVVIPPIAIEGLQIAEAALFDKFIKSEIRARFGKTTIDQRRLARLFPKGSLVRVHADHWGGLMAKVEAVTGRESVKVMVEILGRMTPVEIGAEHLERVELFEKVA